jgi:hypothetical protein
VKLEIEEERYAERSKERGWRRGGEIETEDELDGNWWVDAFTCSCIHDTTILYTTGCMYDGFPRIDVKMCIIVMLKYNFKHYKLRLNVAAIIVLGTDYSFVFSPPGGCLLSIIVRSVAVSGASAVPSPFWNVSHLGLGLPTL